MIGNDVIDLQLARIESNWNRKGFLDKIFTPKEQLIIQKSDNKEIAVWNLWSRKEAAYKIWNRATGIRKFNPTKFECYDLDLPISKVRFENLLYFTKTEISKFYIHTIAVNNYEDFNSIRNLENAGLIKKHHGLPYIIDSNNNLQPISKSHHGRFEKRVYLNNT